MLLGGLWVALAAHESGHLPTGLLMRFRFGFFAIGPLWLAPEGDRIRLRWNRVPASWGGMAMTYPTDDRKLATRMALYAAGGPLASLGVALVAYWTSASLFPATFAGNGDGGGPHVERGATRNGSAVRLRRGASKRWRQSPDASAKPRRCRGLGSGRVTGLDGAARAGIRPRDWQPALVELAAAVRHPPVLLLEAGTCVLRHRLDRGESVEAAQAVDRWLLAYGCVSRWLRGDAAAELAFYFAFARHDPAQAKGYLADAERPLTEAHRRLRARAAVLLRSGDKAGATRAVEEARVAVAKPTLEATALDRDLITAVGAEVGAMGPSLA